MSPSLREHSLLHCLDVGQVLGAMQEATAGGRAGRKGFLGNGRPGQLRNPVREVRAIGAENELDVLARRGIVLKGKVLLADLLDSTLKVERRRSWLMLPAQ